MEHREPPRMGTAESAASRRFARLVPAEAVRRLALPRVLMALGAGLLALLVLGYGLWYLGAHAVRWVEHREEYWVPFQAIELDPAPPPWYRGGAQAFLDRVREAALIKTDRVPILEGELGRVKLAFQKCPWVRAVSRVRIEHPRRVVVTLEYREPVASAVWETKPQFLLDRDGVVLTAEEIDQDALTPLIRIDLEKKPNAPRPGERPKAGEPTDGIQRDDPLIAGAVRLADWLRTARSREGADPSLPPIFSVQIYTGILFIRLEPDIFLRWDEAPGDEPPGTPDTRAKWTAVRDWFREHGAQAVKYPGFLQFVKGRVVVVRWKPPQH